MEVSYNGDTPIAGWFLMENPKINWMMGYTNFKKPPCIGLYISYYCGITMNEYSIFLNTILNRLWGHRMNTQYQYLHNTPLNDLNGGICWSS